MIMFYFLIEVLSKFESETWVYHGAWYKLNYFWYPPPRKNPDLCQDFDIALNSS